MGRIKPSLIRIKMIIDCCHFTAHPVPVTSITNTFIMKTIVVPIDFTAVSSNAARYAIALAEHLDTTVTLLHVYPIPMAFSEVPVPPQVFNALQRDAENFLEEARQDLLPFTGGKVNITTYARPGMFLTSLREFCDEVAPEAIVMSSHGLAGFDRLINGSETSASVTHLTWPLIVVPRGARFKSPKNIAIACDLLNVKPTIPLQLIRKLAAIFNAELHVLHVHNRRSYSDEVIEGTGDLQELLAGLHPSYHFLESRDVTEAILSFVEQHEIDMLMAFPKKHNLLESIFHKSQSKMIAKETTVPLMTIHEQ